MCIICHCGTDIADEYLSANADVRTAMKRAAKAMMVCSQKADTQENRKQYDRTYKRIVRLIREWNQLEEFREAIMAETHPKRRD